MDNEAEGYIPTRAEELERLKHSRAADGGTMALLTASGTLQVEADSDQEEAGGDDEEDEAVLRLDTVASSAHSGVVPQQIVTLAAKPPLVEEDLEEVASQDEQEEEAVAPPAMVDFKPSASFVGPIEGYFFRRGPMGPGYYRDVKQSVAFNAAKATKQNIKLQGKLETEEGEEMRTILMSKKAKNLHSRMLHSNRQKKEAVDKLKRKRESM